GLELAEGGLELGVGAEAGGEDDGEDVPTTTSRPSLRSPPRTSVELPSVMPSRSGTACNLPCSLRTHTVPVRPPESEPVGSLIGRWSYRVCWSAVSRARILSLASSRTRRAAERRWGAGRRSTPTSC